MIKDNNSALTIDNNIKFIAKHVAFETVFPANARHYSGLQYVVSDSIYCNHIITIENISKPPEVYLHCPDWDLMLVEDLDNAIELAQGIVRCRIPSSVEEINDFFQHDFVAEFINGDNQEVILQMIRKDALEIARLDVERAWANPVVRN